MRKATIIGTCMFNSKMAGSVEHGERRFADVFGDEFPGRDFDEWNGDIPTMRRETLSPPLASP